MRRPIPEDLYWNWKDTVYLLGALAIVILLSILYGIKVPTEERHPCQTSDQLQRRGN